MNTTRQEVLELIKEGDVKFIRLGFCDLFGFQKNIAIMADDLPRAFEEGVSFDGHAIKGFSDASESDLRLFPDPATLTVLPWRPGAGGTARLFCDINHNGAPFALDSRQILKRAVGTCAEMGFVCMVGAACEFYLFMTDENGAPTSVTVDKGGYLDIAPLDKSEDIRREICLTLDEIGIQPETAHHGQGPGQNKVSFTFSDALSCADNLMSFKTIVKKIAARNGLFASFMPKPIQDAPGSALHISLSLFEKGVNVFKSDAHAKAAAGFTAGVLSKSREMTLFLNPLANSYERIPSTPDPSLNPYLALALLLEAGLEGIGQGLALPPETDALPENLTQAIALARDSGFVRRVVGGKLLDAYVKAKETEVNYTGARYFEWV
ncbi:MAG: glutamine synthetase family protein [Defluviitaleaceae bacterium]|nr:glutamine synthetase family protein [Defluviitaleaceae bacterium]MCL2239302.1 glutamine synthetase family protein [Defluviitaleaceae bacterium]